MGEGPGAVVVGTGFGCRVHVPALRAAGFEVAALVGRDLERTARRAARLGVDRALTSLDDALALPGVDVVTVATPPVAHPAVVLAAAAAGKHVVCEKPFATGTAEARAMVDAARIARVVGLVGHELRFATERALVGRAIAAGAIGEPRLVTLVQHVPLVADPGAPVPTWWFDPAAGGGWLGASGSHAVDQVRTWLGEITAVSASLGMVSDRDPARAASDTFTVRLTLASGATGVIQQSGGTWGKAVDVTRVAGTHGTLWVAGRQAWLADAAGERVLPVPPELTLAPAPPPSDDPRHRFTHLELGPYTRLCEALRDRIAGRGDADAAGEPGVPVPTFDDGLACTRVLDAIRDSAAHDGTRVDVAA